MSYMFYASKNLSSIDLSNFDTSKVTNMNSMFNGCTRLTSLNLSSFNTSNVFTMNSMFCNCTNINSLNLYNFDTSNVNNTNSMFSGCISLTNLDLYNFYTPYIIDISSMFSGCSNLTYINLSNFNTSFVENISSIFNGCISLNSLDLSNFNVQNVKNISFMFNGCRNLTYLDLSNFMTSQVNSVSHMFYGCFSLKSLDLSNFNTPKVTDMSYMFYDCSSLTSLNLSIHNQLKVNDLAYAFYNCSNLISLDLTNLETSKAKNMANMLYGCSKLVSLDLSNFITTQVIDMSNMFYDCANLEYINLKKSKIKSTVNINNILPMTLQNLMVCTENENQKFFELLVQKIIIHCAQNNLNKNYCYMKTLSLNNNTYLCNICKNDFKFIYNESINNYSFINCFEPRIIECYNSCISCDIEGNETEHNCLKCKDEYIYEFNITNSIYKNCYINNPFESTTYLINDDNTIIQLENRIEKIQNIITNIINEFNFTETNSGKDKKIVDNEKVIIFTSTENQKNNEEDNYITMDLGECENILKDHYHIPYNDSLFILQIISEESGMKIPKMEYEVYYPLNRSKELTKLNLTLCEGTKVEITISVDINGTLDLFNPNSEYYNDICEITTSEIGTDIILRDRRNSFVQNNLSLCEENCELVDYDKVKKKVKCSCDMKSSINTNYDTKFNKDDFFKSFTDVKNILNLNVMKCYKEVLKLYRLKNNYGFSIMFMIIILYFITLILFPNISFKKLKKDIKAIIWAIKCNEQPVNKNKSKNKPEIIRKDIKNKKNKISADKKTFKFKKEKHKRKLKIVDKEEDDSGNRISPQEKEIINEDNKKIYKILKKISFELNGLDYEEGRKLDKRNYFEYYGSLLKYNHPVLFSFAPYNDYNSKIIRIFLFFFSFSLDLTINALFFTDDTMHKIHEDKGQFDFLYQIPQIMYSTLISRFIDSLIRKLALSQDNIVELKQEKQITNKQKKNLLRILKIKFMLYFIVTFISIMFFWYYITCFCGIYVNTQVHLIKDSLISLVTSLLLPFVLYLIPGIFRITALNSEKPDRKILYKFSCILENLLG